MEIAVGNNNAGRAMLKDVFQPITASLNIDGNPHPAALGDAKQCRETISAIVAT